jgi:hypothetical protein
LLSSFLNDLADSARPWRRYVLSNPGRTTSIELLQLAKRRNFWACGWHRTLYRAIHLGTKMARISRTGTYELRTEVAPDGSVQLREGTRKVAFVAMIMLGAMIAGMLFLLVKSPPFMWPLLITIGAGQFLIGASVFRLSDQAWIMRPGELTVMTRSRLRGRTQTITLTSTDIRGLDIKTTRKSSRNSTTLNITSIR